MQQYFTESPLSAGSIVALTAEQSHHAGNVMHLQGKIIRLVHDGEAYFARCEGTGKQMRAVVLEKDESVKELPEQIVLLQALIRREKFEWILQKASELGVTKIVPFISSRCVVQNRKEKEERLKERWTQIAVSACEQCRRNAVPHVEKTVRFEDLKQFMQEENFLAYENADSTSPLLSEAYKGGSASFVIGPEGGFSEEEAAGLKELGFTPVTLGKRILRAETAALYALSVLAECQERNRL